jgi:hypothetical protein
VYGRHRQGVLEEKGSTVRSFDGRIGFGRGSVSPMVVQHR